MQRPGYTLRTLSDWDDWAEDRPTWWLDHPLYSGKGRRKKDRLHARHPAVALTFLRRGA